MSCMGIPPLLSSISQLRPQKKSVSQNNSVTVGKTGNDFAEQFRMTWSKSPKTPSNDQKWRFCVVSCRACRIALEKVVKFNCPEQISDKSLHTQFYTRRYTTMNLKKKVESKAAELTARTLTHVLRTEANSTACFVAYQPKAPKELGRFRREK